MNLIEFHKRPDTNKFIRFSIDPISHVQYKPEILKQ
jgi:hypothetical protein